MQELRQPLLGIDAIKEAVGRRAWCMILNRDDARAAWTKKLPSGRARIRWTAQAVERRRLIVLFGRCRLCEDPRWRPVWRHRPPQPSINRIVCLEFTVRTSGAAGMVGELSSPHITEAFAQGQSEGRRRSGCGCILVIDEADDLATQPRPDAGAP